MDRRLTPFLPFLALVALTLVCFGRLVARPDALLVDGDRASIDHAQRIDPRPVGNDLTFLFLPHYHHLVTQIERHGHLSLWDDRGFGGRPMVGNPQAGLFYPPLWLAWWSRSTAAPGWLTVAHLLWGGIGTYVLLRGFYAGRFASTLAAGCFQVSPYVLAHTFEGHYPHVWSACWYPWAFRAFIGFRRGQFRWALVLPAILALTFLTGHPQEWYYLVFTLGVWAVADAIRAVWAGHRRSAALGIGAWTGLVLLSLGLVAVELVPDLATQGWTLRGSRLALGRVSHYQLRPLNLLQLLSPAALGGPADYFGADNYWETVLSIGLVPLVLATIAVAWHSNRHLVRGWLVLTVASVVFAAGRHLGLFALLFELVPGMDRFRVPGRSLFLATLGASVLAGLGFETLANRSVGLEGWKRLEWTVRQAAMLVAAGLMVGIGLGFGFPSKVSLAASRLSRDGVFWLAFGGIVVAVAWGRRRTADGQVVAVVLGVLAQVELGLHGQAILRVAPADQFLGPDPISAALLRAEPTAPGPFRIRARDILYHDLRAESNGFEKVNINDSFQIQHAADLYETLYLLLYVLPPPDDRDPMAVAVAQFHREVRQGVLDRLGVAFLVSDHVESNPSWPLVAAGTWRGSFYAVHRNPTAMPRAYVVPRARIVADSATANLTRFRTADPHMTVQMERDPLETVGDPRQAFRTAEWASTDPDRVVLRVATEAPGLLVVADTWMPGWTATIDGQPAPIYRGNHAQRVIALASPGHHEVIMRYEPPGLACGLAITTASALAWAVAFVTLLRKRPPVRVGYVKHTGLWPPGPNWRGSQERPESNATLLR
jgi:hypothetical protein